MIKENHSLKAYNSFGIDVSARYFVEITKVAQLKVLLESDLFKYNARLILGGGSNVLLTKDFPGLVLKLSIRGISIEKEAADFVWLKAMAGEVWHDVVQYSLKNGLGGLENLSLIPGQVGAAPMQNIGAYGVELESVFDHLEAIEISSAEIKKFHKDDCAFGYRESVFKNIYKDKFIIVSVVFKLSKSQDQVNITYGAIRDVLNEKGITKPDAKAVSDAVIAIRQSKLPNPKELGNAGSFFKNPVIEKQQLERLKADYPEIPSYDLGNDQFKVPAGWLIEQCGWKGKVVGNTGSHKRQALVLVNYGNATGKEIKTLADEIRKSVYDKFGIKITPEVNII
ncbi:MAG: UDP-N-acetylmuramate dehydrogenase [Chitinophagales bacterium]